MRLVGPAAADCRLQLQESAGGFCLQSDGAVAVTAKFTKRQTGDKIANCHFEKCSWFRPTRRNPPDWEKSFFKVYSCILSGLTSLLQAWPPSHKMVFSDLIFPIIALQQVPKKFHNPCGELSITQVSFCITFNPDQCFWSIHSKLLVVVDVSILNGYTLWTVKYSMFIVFSLQTCDAFKTGMHSIYVKINLWKKPHNTVWLFA